jgi:threonine/homoserine/homoserine lactone efflux protein
MLHMGILFWILFLGLVAGISVALPYGPVGFVIIRRFYLFGMRSGMYSAVGTVLSDGFYAIVVGFGLHKISNFLLSIANYAEVFAGLTLLYIGAKAMKQKIHLHEDAEENHPVQDVTSTLFLNFLNPTLIFSFALIFTILEKILHGSRMSFDQVTVFIGGIAIGTLGFWFLVGSGIHYLRTKNRHELVQKINYITGIVLMVLGVLVLGGAVVHWILK